VGVFCTLGVDRSEEQREEALEFLCFWLAFAAWARTTETFTVLSHCLLAATNNAGTNYYGVYILL